MNAGIADCPDALGVSGVAQAKIASAANNYNAALFVGASSFQTSGAQTFQHLRFASKDAIDMAYLFVVSMPVIPATNCVLLISHDELINPKSMVWKSELRCVTNRLAELQSLGVRIGTAGTSDIEDALDWLGKPERTAPESLALVYFASHGEISSSEAYIASDHGRVRPVGGLVAFDAIKDALMTAAASKKILIVDACRSRRLANGRDAGIGEDPSTVGLKDLIDRSLPGCATFLSCQDGGRSYEDPDLCNGLFTHFLIQTLGGAVSIGTNEFITLGSVATLVSAKVDSRAFLRTGNHQLPYIHNPSGDILSLPLCYSRFGLQVRDLRERLRESLSRWTPRLSTNVLDEIANQTSAATGDDLRKLLSDLNERLSVEPTETAVGSISNWLSQLRRPLIEAPHADQLNQTNKLLLGDTLAVDLPVSGTKPLYFHWMYRHEGDNTWTILNGRTNRILVIQCLAANHFGQYQLHVSNSFSQVSTSGVITVSLRRRPLRIVEQPFLASEKVRQGQSIVLSVLASGGETIDPLRYRWQYRKALTNDWMKTSEGTNANFTLSEAQPSDSGGYRVRVFNLQGEEEFSDPVRLTVVAPLKWADYERSEFLDQCLNSSLDLEARASGNEPIHYQWQFAGSNTGPWNDLKSKTRNTLSIEHLAEDQSGFYRAMASDSQGQRLEGAPIKLVVRTPLEVTWPTSLTVRTCEPVDFRVQVSSTPASVKWYKVASDSTYEVLTDAFAYHLESASLQDAATFRVIIHNDCGDLQSPDFNLVVMPRQLLTFTLVTAPGRTFRRENGWIYDVTNGGHIAVGTQVQSGFVGPVAAIQWFQGFPFMTGFGQILECGPIIGVQTTTEYNVPKDFTLYGQFVD